MVVKTQRCISRNWFVSVSRAPQSSQMQCRLTRLHHTILYDLLARELKDVTRLSSGNLDRKSLPRPKFTIASQLSHDTANHALELVQTAYRNLQSKTIRAVGVTMQTEPPFDKGQGSSPDTILEDWTVFPFRGES